MPATCSFHCLQQGKSLDSDRDCSTAAERKYEWK